MVRFGCNLIGFRFTDFVAQETWIGRKRSAPGAAVSVFTQNALLDYDNLVI